MKQQKALFTQKEIILNHLNKKSLTSLEAFNHYGIMSLNVIIHRLRRSGCDIETTKEEGENRFGMEVEFARYTLNK